MCTPMAFHGFPDQFQCCLAIPALRSEAFQDFTFVVHSPPKIARLAGNLNEYLIQMPLPVCPRPDSINPSPANFSGKYWAKSVPPKPNRFVADVDASLVQKVLQVPKRKREATIRSTPVDAASTSSVLQKLKTHDASEKVKLRYFHIITLMHLSILLRSVLQKTQQFAKGLT